MKMIHDAAVRTDLETRLAALRPDSPRRWGSMSPGKMLWHVNLFLQSALGEGALQTRKPPIPAPLLKLMLLYLPWPKGAPTHPAAVATEEHDFEEERARCQNLIERFVSRPLDGHWPVDPTFGKVDGLFASRLQAKHLDHHFRQFGG